MPPEVLTEHHAQTYYVLPIDYPRAFPWQRVKGHISMLSAIRLATPRFEIAPVLLQFGMAYAKDRNCGKEWERRAAQGEGGALLTLGLTTAIIND